jgi:hypothetical protein
MGANLAGFMSMILGDLDVFAGRCGQWNDAYLLEEYNKGAAAYADARYFAAIQAEIARRGLSPETPQPPSSLPQAAAPSDDGALFPRLWRGEVPLAEAYWIWGYITNLVIAILTRLALEALPILGFFLWLLGIAYAGFIAVAIWRSADHYRGRPLWATLAKVSVALGMTISVATMLAVFGATF